MTVSRERGRFKVCDAGRTSRGQFHTTGAAWLLPQVLDFLDASGATAVLDPFAGAGDLLRAVAETRPGLARRGIDIDPRHADRWETGDSLRSIPAAPGTILVTNPPHLARHSARRKGVLARVEAYYRSSGRSDLYQVALDACLAAARHTVAILPETVLRSGFELSSFRHVSVVLEDLFEDTDQPVVVACLDREWTAGPDLYRGPQRLGPLAELAAHRIEPRFDASITFNAAGGGIGLRAVDLQDPAKPIAFLTAAALGYPAAGIKASSRLVTHVALEPSLQPRIPWICEAANRILADIRHASHDAVLSPFKGNTKDGRRRRRLDYRLARAILETAIREVNTEKLATKNTKNTKKELK